MSALFRARPRIAEVLRIAIGEGLAELAALDEPCCAGDSDATGLVSFAVEPLAEFSCRHSIPPKSAFPALFDPVDEFMPDLLAEFASPGLFDPVDELVLLVLICCLNCR